MVTAVAVRPLSITVPLMAPVSSFTVICAVPEALELGVGSICAEVIVTVKAAWPVVVKLTAGVVAVSLALSVILPVTMLVPAVMVVLSHMTVSVVLVGVLEYIHYV